MHKRIFNSFAGLVLISIVALAALFSILFMNAAQTHEMAAVRDKAYLVSGLLNSGTFEYGERLNVGNIRMTIIAPDGWALFDNHAGADLSANRSDRIEFIEAIIHGSGESIRNSDTLGADTYYYAIRLSNGNVLRLSQTMNSLGEVFPSILPNLVIITMAILGLAYFTTYRLTRRIIKPLAAVDFENTDAITDSVLRESLYEELWPYVKKIDHQKQEIANQMMTLKSRAETIEAIIANMREGLVLLDEKGLVMVANKSVLDIFDIPKEQDIIQKNIRHIYRDTEFVQAVKQCLEGAHLETNFARNGRVYNVFLNPVINDENSCGAIIFFLDTTEQFKAETQRREFTANVSHELKTPLTTISALSEMMASGMVKATDVPDFAIKISDHTKRLINIIDDIIRLSEFDESKVEKEFSTFDIYELAKSVISALQEKAAERSVTIELTGQQLKLNANKRLLDELMYNLIDNGIKYNKEGGNVTLNLSEENGWCKISVTDTGIGISKEHQGRVFERFYRVDSSRSKKTGGTGLGLSIVKHITEHHSGKVVLESIEDMGTAVVCYIAIKPLVSA
ncbi:MAG: ATP-binding protein [Oscillospiraceae bacterium]|nr:ATP-binding protein [Oscillospiraceae bacterium]